MTEAKSRNNLEVGISSVRSRRGDAPCLLDHDTIK